MPQKSKYKNPIPGRLFLIPTGLGEAPLLETLPLLVRKKVEELDHYIVENEKTARHFIKKLVPSKSQPALHFEVLNKFTKPEQLPSFLTPCLSGTDMGLMSEAGCPGIADPGAKIVRLAHQKNIKVLPLVGPSSITLAMMASGLNGQNFAFNGYLPIDKHERKKTIKKLEKKSFENQQAQLFIETPYRNEKLLKDLKRHLHPNTLLCIAREITTPTEFIQTKTIKAWRNSKISLHKKPTIFVLQKM